ncbi:hypothetical protein ACP4OV_007831 [Aristida adscensionis]
MIEVIKLVLSGIRSIRAYILEMDNKIPYILAITTVLIYTGMYVISKAAFNNGMNTFVFIFYRQAAASLLLVPAALIFEREKFAVHVVGVALEVVFLCLNRESQNLTNASVKITSATVASATSNSIPVITFCLALLCRIEAVKLRSASGVAKLAAVALCLAGALVTAFYTGPSFSPVRRHRAFGGSAAAAGRVSGDPSRRTWILGTFLMVLANLTWSLWLVLQAKVLKEHPNKMLVTTAQCVFSALQSFVAAAVAERDFSRWKLRLDVSLFAVLYTGFVVTGVAYYLQAWCIEMKGPVFLAVWSPLCFVLTIFCSSFFLGEIVHLGSIIGGLLLVFGLYSMLWGKSRESKNVLSSVVHTIDSARNEQEHRENQGEEGGECPEEATSTSAVERV